MSTIKIFLEADEQERVQHYAESLGVSAEDVAYVALNRLMHDIKKSEDELAKEIVDARDCRNPPVAYWSATTLHVSTGPSGFGESRNPWH